MNKFLLLLFLCCFQVICRAQTDPFAGTWKIENNVDNTPVSFTLQIGTPDKSSFYPAKMSIQCDSFSAVYELLLVKKSSRELAISKNKFARVENIFNLSPQLFYVNGLFDLSRDLKGRPTLNLKRIQPTKSFNAPIPDTVKKNPLLAPLYRNLCLLLQQGEIKLYKQNGLPWNSEYANRIVTPSLSPAYFGLTDTIFMPTRDGVVNISGVKKGDVITAVVNGKKIVELLEVTKKNYIQEIMLDTGLNILILHAENFAGELPNKSRLTLDCGKKRVALDFNNRGDSGASFIAAKIYFAREKEKETFFDNYTPANDKPLKENEKLLGTLTSTARQLTLAVWDDAVEDGDSISINVNGKWIARGFPVKTRPQTITITLEPGPNTITFIADNLGSIAPNTSLLEIIDGKKRKAFTLATTIGEDNLVKIFYDNQPDR